VIFGLCTRPRTARTAEEVGACGSSDNSLSFHRYMLYCGFNLDQEGSSAQSSLAMKLLLEALFAALVLMVVLVSLVALAKY
jgi:hypothetical protein